MMTSPTLARFGRQWAAGSGQSAARETLPTADRRPPTSAAFTLIEMLVVIGVIVLIASLLLVAVNKVYRQGARTKIAADLQAISAALDAYKADFGSYPPVDGLNTGPAVLAKALIGPSAKGTTGTWKQGQFLVPPPPTPPNPPQPSYIALVDNPTNPATPTPALTATDDWATFSPFDGADGAGPEFKQAGIRVGPKTIDDNPEDGIPDRPGGKVYGPYLQPERFIKQVDSGMLVDAVGKPILYFPAASGVNVAAAQGYVSNDTPGTPPKPKFDVNDNIRFFVRTGESTGVNATARMRVMFGDYGADGALNTQFTSGNESDGAESAPYVLWSAGDDGLFGPNVPAAGNPQRGEIYTLPNSLDQWKHNSNSANGCDDVVSFK